MNTIYLIHLCFIAVSAYVGYSVASLLDTEASSFGMGAGILFGAALVALATSLKEKKVKRFCWGAFGFFIGLASGSLLFFMTEPLFDFHPIAAQAWKGISFLIFSYIGIILGLKAEENPGIFSNPNQGGESAESLKILDTSVIIDGRIADLCETGFLEGVFIAPQFILQELQHIADSSDSMKRARGRRGLDVLHKLQQMPDLEVRIVDHDFPAIRDVDSKIVALGKKLSAKVMTNDLNLNKVAELQGVRVLNINQLCNAMKPVVLPGEEMQVFVLKEGKELGQGIAYLDDGTMIVIDEARKCIGKTVPITVTSVLQTPAGRMIFSRLKEETPNEAVSVARGN
ncbi:MAG: PIN/TRAM domain-containing protein [Nitrospiria bacterium]